MSKVNKTVVMRVTPDEAAKLRYQRKFDKAWAREQAWAEEQVRTTACITSIMAAREVFAANKSKLPDVVHFPHGWSPAKCEEAMASMPELFGRHTPVVILDELSEVAQ